MAVLPKIIHDNRLKLTGMFWYSKSQLTSLLDWGHPRKYCKLWETGEIREYTEFVSHSTLQDEPFERCIIHDAICLGEGEFFGWDRMPNLHEIGKQKFKIGR